MSREDIHGKPSSTYTETVNPWDTKNLVHMTPLDTLKDDPGNWTFLGGGLFIGDTKMCLAPDVPHWNSVLVKLFAYLAGAKRGRIRNPAGEYDFSSLYQYTLKDVIASPWAVAGNGETVRTGRVGYVVVNPLTARRFITRVNFDWDAFNLKRNTVGTFGIVCIEMDDEASGTQTKAANVWKRKNLFLMAHPDTEKLNLWNWQFIGYGLFIGGSSICLVSDIPHWYPYCRQTPCAPRRVEAELDSEYAVGLLILSPWKASSHRFGSVRLGRSCPA